jgi:hypothetical protein
MLKRAARKPVAISFATKLLTFCILLREFFIESLALRLGHPLSAVLRSAFRAYMIRAQRKKAG